MKNGFTLIEMLMTIVIIGIVLLIAVPAILSTVSGMEKASFKTSVSALIKAVDVDKVKNKYVLPRTYEYENKKLYLTCVKDECYDTPIEISVKGEIPSGSGKIYVSENDKTSIAVYNGQWCASKMASDSSVTVSTTTASECVVNTVNAPVLAAGMTAIKWDSNNNEVATTASDPDWYNYDTRKWANAKTADGSYWVWIPRYAYAIETCYHNSCASKAGTVSIVFLQGTTNTTYEGVEVDIDPVYSVTFGVSSDSSSNASIIGLNNTKKTYNIQNIDVGPDTDQTNYILHPAFSPSTSFQLEGIWVAKYEASGTTGDINIVPNVSSLRSLTISQMFNASLDMQTQSANYGWNNSNVGTHMMKNTEWGMVAYMSVSSYGKAGEVWRNNSNYITGCSGTSPDSNYVETCQNTYNSANGVNASTTGNIYGIYDMNGGTWEYTMANYDNTIADAGIDPATINSEYIDIYGDDYSNYYFGDAVFEVSFIKSYDQHSWYNDYSYIPSNWHVRGGGYSYSEPYATTGLFSFKSAHSDGGASTGISFRPVVVSDNR